METEGSLPFSQDPATGPYPETIPRPCITFRNKLFSLRWRVVNPPAGGSIGLLLEKLHHAMKTHRRATAQRYQPHTKWMRVVSFTPRPHYTRGKRRGTYRNINYKGRLQSSWTHLITPRRNFVEVRWRSLFRSTSLGNRWNSYNAPPTSRKRAPDRWPLRNFLPRSSLFVVGKAQKSYRPRSGLYGGCSNGVPPIHFFQAEHRIQFRSRPMRFLCFSNHEKGALEARNFEMINGLQHVFEKWVERCKKCIACQRRYFEKETVTAPPQISDSE
jgi:hypothetical protein